MFSKNFRIFICLHKILLFMTTPTLPPDWYLESSQKPMMELSCERGITWKLLTSYAKKLHHKFMTEIKCTSNPLPFNRKYDRGEQKRLTTRFCKITSINICSKSNLTLPLQPDGFLFSRGREREHLEQMSLNLGIIFKFRF